LPLLGYYAVRVDNSYRTLGPAYRSHLQASRITDCWRWEGRSNI